jgi:hypothetical protein
MDRRLFNFSILENGRKVVIFCKEDNTARRIVVDSWDDSIAHSLARRVHVTLIGRSLDEAKFKINNLASIMHI